GLTGRGRRCATGRRRGGPNRSPRCSGDRRGDGARAGTQEHAAPTTLHSAGKPEPKARRADNRSAAGAFEPGRLEPIGTRPPHSTGPVHPSPQSKALLSAFLRFLRLLCVPAFLPSRPTLGSWTSTSARAGSASRSGRGRSILRI